LLDRLTAFSADLFTCSNTMTTDTTIHVPQDRETPATLIEHPGYWCRYAYARSADSRAVDDRGQDCLVLQATEQRFLFALCDGVSQSFVGDLAARLLADALLTWLAQVPLAAETAQLQQDLSDRLAALVDEAQPLVAAFALPKATPPLVRDVLEQKRTLGSESTFVAGILDLNQGQILLAWMGDSRLRSWHANQECSTELGATFHTAERWSSRQGAVGTPHLVTRSLIGISRLLCYSDGLAQLDQYDAALSNRELDALITAAGEAPNSDDISIIEVWLE
jgi:hypothetical protein